MPLKVSVVIPVWNPGPNIQRCIDSLLAQTLRHSDYEIICVDDGSTDGTAELLDRLAATRPSLIRVIHIENSGWPGKPRNVGIDAAGAPYIQLVDNDDALPSYALESLHQVALTSDADVVFGRPSSDFRGMNHSVYRQDIIGGTLAEHPELALSLTPHKMFRRELLQRNDIRFPTGPVPLEDQLFVLKAYLHARSISLLTDRPYYRYLRRMGSGRNAGDRAIDPAMLCRSMDMQLDIVEEGAGNRALRDWLFLRALRVVLLPQLSRRTFVDADIAMRRATLDAVRRLLAERFGPEPPRAAGAAHRTLYHLARDGDLSGITGLASQFGSITVRARAVAARWQEGTLRFRLNGTLLTRRRPVQFEAAGARVGAGTGRVGERPDEPAARRARWALPTAWAPSVPRAARLLEVGTDPVELEVSVVDRATGLSYAASHDVRVWIDRAGAMRLAGEVVVDPARAAAGAPLGDGVWDLRLRLRFEGWYRVIDVLVSPDDLAAPLLAGRGRTVRPHLSDRRGALALDVNQWLSTIAAEVAPSAMLTTSDRGDLELTVRADVAPDACPAVEVMLERKDDSTAAGVVCAGTLRGHGHSARCQLAVPPDLPDGRWRVWLRLCDLPAEPPTRLRWQLIRSAGTLSVQRAPSAQDAR